MRRSERGKPNQRFSWRAGRTGFVRACFHLRSGNSKHPGGVFFLLNEQLQSPDC